MEFAHKEKYNIEDLLEIVRILREPGGCPWDAEQTHQSIRKNLIEETYEVAEAIDLEDRDLLCEELGDLLLQVVMHVQMEQEEGSFGFDEVCDGICKKLVYRHPHVFGELQGLSTKQVLRNWEALKNAEKGRESAKDRLKSVPAGLPAAMRAAKVQKRAADYGFAYADVQQALNDLDAEVAELKEAVRTGQGIEGEAGDVLFSAVNVSRMLRVDAEEALGKSTDKFANRVVAAEEMAAESGETLENVNAERLDTLWKRAKALEEN